MAEILVLGAGMVGVCTALALQADNHDVCILDRRGPGQETSFGNAGVIQAEAREPYAFPRAPATLLSYALGQSNDVIYDLPALPRMARALYAYFRNSAPGRHAQISPQYAQMIAQASFDHNELAQDAHALHLIRKNGLGEIYGLDSEFDERRSSAETLARRYDLGMSILEGKDIAEQENLNTRPAGAILWHDSWSVTDPGALVAAYADLFRARGGRIAQGEIKTLEPQPPGWRVAATAGMFQAQHVVVALGPWSPRAIEHLGYRIPMVMKRGYHAHYENAHELSRPYLFADHAVVASSMAKGLRVTTGAHLALQSAPRKLGQLQRAAAGLNSYLNLGTQDDKSIWSGTRPCLPQMLPKVGPAGSHRGLWFNFGHGHQGFTLGPTSGKALARQIAQSQK